MNKKDETRRLEKLWSEERDPVEKVKGKLRWVRHLVRERGQKIVEDNPEFRYRDYIDMTDQEVEEALQFHGETCCRFCKMNPEKDVEKMADGLQPLENYGGCLNFENGTMINDFASDFEGGRFLLKCPECGAYFVQVTGKNCVAFFDDDYYTYRYDYFQVESPEHAHKLNLLTAGALSGYEGPHFGTSSVR